MTQAEKEEIIEVINEIGAAVDGDGEVEVINSASDIGNYNVTLPGIRRDNQGNFVGYVVANISMLLTYIENATNLIKNTWESWFGANDQSGIRGEWSIMSTGVQAATTAANNAATAAAGAENVDAELNGYVVTITNRAGVSRSIDLEVDISGKLNRITEAQLDAIFEP